jgi:hypothetical protein
MDIFTFTFLQQKKSNKLEPKGEKGGNKTEAKRRERKYGRGRYTI